MLLPLQIGPLLVTTGAPGDGSTKENGPITFDEQVPMMLTEILLYKPAPKPVIVMAPVPSEVLLTFTTVAPLE